MINISLWLDVPQTRFELYKNYWAYGYVSRCTRRHYGGISCFWTNYRKSSCPNSCLLYKVGPKQSTQLPGPCVCYWLTSNFDVTHGEHYKWHADPTRVLDKLWFLFQRYFFLDWGLLLILLCVWVCRNNVWCCLPTGRTYQRQEGLPQDCAEKPLPFLGGQGRLGKRRV